ncbi:K(+) efflux antiporter chloroplastic [Chlorella sorokiniana]|uniref:K(+) efflux antiporter chloroplastic n=1 Tax=Chlorella sorokiniana TaxID=3076 RepID=A0A2P6TQP8_CHLSO|nr:K(+) efflux antiporter chloroplastic [Chlorella sorokiniana]|eukprot:PRW56322.1 K(+) efflux antiporter chloroplastic [Chlorella sorokiniana]
MAGLAVCTAALPKGLAGACRLPRPSAAGTQLAAVAQQQRHGWRRRQQQRQQRQQQAPGLVACAALGGSTSLPPRRRLAAPPPPQPQQQQPLPQLRPATVGRLVAARAVYGGGYDPLVNLGSDFLTFLVATVLVVPVFKSAKQSPVLGYLFAGLVLGQLGLFRNLEEVEKLSELGVLFLLFEMGLELSIDRLRALARFAFGMGTLQMLICTLAFIAVGLPPGTSFFSQFLENVLHAPPALAELRTVDEAVVIGAALSLSSSAFVLQLLRERGELDTRFGQATLGILLLQDIATVPFLVLLPLIEGSNSALMEGQDTMSLVAQLGPTALKTIGGLGAVLLGGRLLMRRVFELVAEAKSEETFVALCLLTVTGASLITQRMGFSDTLGAFVAGVLLSETNFKTQVEADIQPFRGILLGLFFVTTGSSLDVSLLVQQWPLVLTLLAGLLGTKIAIISALGPVFGLSRAESVRTGFILSQGGEFAFVLLALANQLNVLPADLNRLLIIVVVLSMALTPLLTEVGKKVGEVITKPSGDAMLSSEGYNVSDPVVILSFGDVGQTVANMLESPALGRPVPYMVFDLTVARVQAAQEAGFNVLYGDGSRPKVLHAAGIERPRAIVVAYTARQRSVLAVESLHQAYPGVPIYVRALDMQHAAALQEAGATTVISAAAEAGLAVGSSLAKGLGVPGRAVSSLADVLRQELDVRAHQIAEEKRIAGGKSGEEGEAQAVSVFKFDQSRAPAFSDDQIERDSEMAAADLGGTLGSGGLLGSLGSLISTLESVSGTASGSDEEGKNSAPGAANGGRLGAAGAIDVEVDVVSMLASTDLEGGDVPFCPDGSEECPIPWQAMTSGEEAAEQPAAAANAPKTAS